MTTTDTTATATEPGRWATTARKTGKGALKILGLLTAGLAGLLAGELAMTYMTWIGLSMDGWRGVVHRVLAVSTGLAVFWFAYGFPRDLWRLRCENRARERDES